MKKVIYIREIFKNYFLIVDSNYVKESEDFLVFIKVRKPGLTELPLVNQKGFNVFLTINAK